MKQIDARGLQCPQPVVLTKKALEEMLEGELECIVDNITARENVSRLATNLEYEFSVAEKDGLYYIKIKKANKEGLDNKEQNNDFVIVIANDKLGTGIEELGKVLIKGYIYALTEVKPLPKAMMFLNGGVKLTTEGSEVIENLKRLEELGVEMISCGTCLDYYGLKEKVQVGIIGNMYLIVEKMNTAAKVINI